MQPHTVSTVLINAPITYVWKELWEDLLEDSLINEGTNITKKKSTEIHRTVSLNGISYRQVLTKNEKEKTIRSDITDGDVRGDYCYSIEQSPKGEVVIRLESSAVDSMNRPFPPKQNLDQLLMFHKANIETKRKTPKKGMCSC